MKTIKMVKGSTYACPHFGGRTLTVGETITLDDDKADFLLKDTYSDTLNNEHSYFVEVTEEAPADSTGEGDEAGGEGKPAAAARPRRAASAPKQ